MRGAAASGQPLLLELWCPNSCERQILPLVRTQQRLDAEFFCYGMSQLSKHDPRHSPVLHLLRSYSKCGYGHFPAVLRRDEFRFIQAVAIHRR